MAQPSGVFSTYDAIGNREDLADVIYDISPIATPFLSGIARAEAEATFHEWQTDSLASAAQNAVIEGDDATTDTAASTARRGNYTQIADKVPRVTGTQQAVRKAGRKDELAYQIAKRAKELKRDMEFDLLSNNARNAGSDTAARVSAGVPAWIATNQSVGTSGSAPTGDGTNARVNGTQRAFTEAMLKTVLNAAFTQGGDPDTIMVGAFNKQTFSSFTGGANKQVDVKDKKLVASVTIYESDYGILEVVPNRFMRARDCLILQMDMWAVAYLRSFHIKPLARDGDSERKQLLVEYTLESRNQAASGIVADLETA